MRKRAIDKELIDARRPPENAVSAMLRFHEMTVNAIAADEMQDALNEILAATIELHQADFGNVQLLAADGCELKMVAQSGFKRPFLEAFGVVNRDDDTACGRALRTRETCSIEDITKDAAYEPYRQYAAEAGFCAVQSVPLLCSNGDLVGVLSTHFSEPRAFSDWDKLVGGLAARQAADLIANRQQRDKLAELNDSLANRAAELAVRDDNKDKFLSTLGHELRNPLAAIRNSIELVAAGEEEAHRTGLAILRRQSDQLLALVNDLLELERVKRGKIEMKLEVIDVASTIRDAVNAHRGRIEAKKLALELRLPGEPIYLMADRARLLQVLGNLLDNSIRFTEEGGICIAVEKQADMARVSVTDTGCGIAPHELDAVFEPYYQTDSGQTGAGGLGFGLALVKALIGKHGGGIEVRSEGRGKGSEFTFTMPLANPVHGGEEKKKARTGKLRAHRILVVDDQRDNADSFAALLRTLGQEVNVAYDGVSAIEVTGKWRPEVAFLDLSMPGMNGHELASNLRRLFSGDELTLVALTGIAPRASAEADFTHYLLKPAMLDDIVELLSSLPETPGSVL